MSDGFPEPDPGALWAGDDKPSAPPHSLDYGIPRSPVRWWLLLGGAGVGTCLLLIIVLRGHIPRGTATVTMDGVCEVRFEKLAYGLSTYAQRSGGKYPASLELLRANGYIPMEQFTIRPLSRQMDHGTSAMSSEVAEAGDCVYLYRGGVAVSDGTAVAILHQMPRYSGGTERLLFADGHITSTAR